MAIVAKRNSSNESSPYQKVAWTGTAADYDILANAPGYDATSSPTGYCCRALIVASPAGALVYVDASGNTVTVPQAILLAQPYLPAQARSLVAAGSGNAYVMVLW